MSGTVSLEARPEPIELGRDTSAVIVNDMQNAFVSPGGYLDKVGFDISGAQAVVAAVNTTLEVARAAGLPVFYFRNGFDPALHAAAMGSPWRIKSPALRLMREQPELAGTLLIRGTWDHEIVDALTPRPGDVVVDKTRPSCFAGTNLDMLLNARGIRAIVVVGIASNVGVEWTMRDGLSREFFCVLLEDATMPAGPDYVHAATVFNVETFVGWVSTTTAFADAFGTRQPIERQRDVER